MSTISQIVKNLSNQNIDLLKEYIEMIRNQVNKGITVTYPNAGKIIAKMFRNGFLGVNYGAAKESGFINVQSFRDDKQTEEFLLDIVGIFRQPYLESRLQDYICWNYLKLAAKILKGPVNFDIIGKAIQIRNDDFFIVATKHQKYSKQNIEEAFRTGYPTAIKYFLDGRCEDVDVDKFLTAYIWNASDDETVAVLEAHPNFDPNVEQSDKNCYWGFTNLKDHAFLYGKKKVIKLLQDRGIDMRSVLEETDPLCPKFNEMMEKDDNSRQDIFFKTRVNNIPDYRRFFHFYAKIKNYKDLCDKPEFWFNIIRNSSHKYEGVMTDDLIYRVSSLYERGLANIEFGDDLKSIDILFNNERHRIHLNEEDKIKVAEYIVDREYTYRNAEWVSQILKMNLIEIDGEYRLLKLAIELEDEEFFDLVLQYDKPNEGVFWIAFGSRWKYAIDILNKHNYGPCEYSLYYPNQDVSILEYALVECITNSHKDACIRLERMKDIIVLDMHKKFQIDLDEPRYTLFEFCIIMKFEVLMSELQKFYELSMDDILNNGYLSDEIHQEALQNIYLFKEVDKLSLDFSLFDKHVSNQVKWTTTRLVNIWNLGGRYREYLFDERATVWKEVSGSFYKFGEDTDAEFRELAKTKLPHRYFD